MDLHLKIKETDSKTEVEVENVELELTFLGCELLFPCL